jgi:hypothetical protein
VTACSGRPPLYKTGGAFRHPKEVGMSPHDVHEGHGHEHRQGCGHATIDHDGHRDYLHDGHMHHGASGRYEEHAIPVSAANPETCTQGHACGVHGSSHKHGPGCGHHAIPHGSHTDYLVDGHLHHQHGEHCDDHGKVSVKG